MTERKLTKYLARPLPDLSLQSNVKYIVLSDSKGSYLKDQVFDSRESRHIIWWYQGGARTAEQLQFAKRKLGRELEGGQKVLLLCWLGTCDLTAKRGKYISLRFSQIDEGVCFLTERYRSLLALSSTFSGLTVVLLEVPPISIVEWNRAKGHPNPDDFKEADSTLDKQIQAVNRWCAEHNTVSVPTPRFGKDLLKSCKRKHKEIRYSLDFRLYRDGVHPGVLLAQAWLRRLTLFLLNTSI